MECRKLCLEDIGENEQTKIYNWMKESFLLNFGITQEIASSESKHQTEKMILFIKDGSAHVYGAFQDESFVGFAWYYQRIFLGLPRLHLSEIVVDSQFRSKGIADLLLDAGIQLAKELGNFPLELNVTISNKQAMSLYEKNAFLPERQLMVRKE